MSPPAALSSVEILEAAMLASWPALETMADGKWVSRFSRGHTKRSNALTIIDAADGGEVERRLDAVAAEYRRRGLPPTHRLTPLTPPEVRSALEARGAAPFERSVALGGMLETGLSIDPRVRVLPPAEPSWIDAQGRFHGFSAPTMATMSAMLALISMPAAAFLLEDDAGAPVAAAMMLLTGGLGMLVKVVVAPAARGRGLGRRVVASALGWAAEQGAKEVFLHTLADNAAAISLYGSMGLVERYSYSHVVFG